MLLTGKAEDTRNDRNYHLLRFCSRHGYQRLRSRDGTQSGARGTVPGVDLFHQCGDLDDIGRRVSRHQPGAGLL